MGWFYAAFTEYLGFEAYDGEYKIMGLAAYGKGDAELEAKVAKLVWYDGQGGFETDPMLLSRGKRSFSYYYPDALAEYMGRNPRADNEEITPWHIDLAYAVQKRLETIVEKMLQYWVAQTGMRNLAVAGGVGLNVKMSGTLFTSGLVDDIFVHPLCADAGVSIGAAMVLEYFKGELELSRLQDVYFGPSYDDEEIERVLQACKLPYTREESIAKSVS